MVVERAEGKNGGGGKNGVKILLMIVDTVNVHACIYMCIVRGKCVFADRMLWYEELCIIAT